MKAAHEKGDEEGSLSYAMMLKTGQGVPADIPASVGIIEALAQSGNLAARIELANLYVSGVGVTRDVEKGLQILHELSSAGVPMAHLRISEILLKGEGGHPTDIAAGMEALKHASDKGFHPAMFNLALRLVKTDPPDVEQALQLLQKASEEGFVSAMFVLGSWYAEGKVVKQDMATAAAWYTQAATKGFAPAMVRSFPVGV